jgi:hypothetical protein
MRVLASAAIHRHRSYWEIVVGPSNHSSTTTEIAYLAFHVPVIAEDYSRELVQFRTDHRSACPLSHSSRTPQEAAAGEKMA